MAEKVPESKTEAESKWLGTMGNTPMPGFVAEHRPMPAGFEDLGEGQSHVGYLALKPVPLSAEPADNEG